MNGPPRTGNRNRFLSGERDIRIATADRLARASGSRSPNADHRFAGISTVHLYGCGVSCVGICLGMARRFQHPLLGNLVVGFPPPQRQNAPGMLKSFSSGSNCSNSTSYNSEVERS